MPLEFFQLTITKKIGANFFEAGKIDKSMRRQAEPIQGLLAQGYTPIYIGSAEDQKGTYMIVVLYKPNV